MLSVRRSRPFPEDVSVPTDRCRMSRAVYSPPPSPGGVSVCDAHCVPFCGPVSRGADHLLSTHIPQGIDFIQYQQN